MTIINQPDECQDMTDIRREIDAIDRLVIALIGRRFKYVQAAAKFKRTQPM
jgi:isochorismate pyruvate lyase